MMEYIKALFDGVWGLFQIKFPGFDFSIAAVSLAALAAVLGLRILGQIFGFSFSPGQILGHVRGGNNSKIKVSANRKNDTR